MAKAILDRAITVEFEPIEDLAAGRVVGFEARPRVATLPHRSYDTWLADAEAADLLLDMEMAAFRAGLLGLAAIPDDLFLEFEVTPSTLTEGRFRRAIRRPIGDRVVLGLSPLAPVDASVLGAAGPSGILADASWTRCPDRRERGRTGFRRPSTPHLAFAGTGPAGRNAGSILGQKLLEPLHRRRPGRLCIGRGSQVDRSWSGLRGAAA